MTVAGTNYIARSALSCRFGSSLMGASFVSATRVTCLSPAHLSGTVAVGVSLNRQDVTTDSVYFTYHGIFV